MAYEGHGYLIMILDKILHFNLANDRTARLN